MPSTATSRNRFEKQATGENTNTWGSKLNTTALDLIDFALDGRTAFTLSGSKALSSTNFAADEARARFLDITSGTGGTVTLPAVEKLYLVRNKASGNAVFTTGGPTNATIAANGVQWIATDGSNVYADTSASEAAAAAAAAAASAASINDSTLVHKSGTENIGGIKTFTSGIVASAGITINGQVLDGLSAIGVTIAEAANAAAARTALNVVPGADVQAFHANLAALAGLTIAGNAFKILRVNSSANGLELALPSTNDTIVSDVAVTGTSGFLHNANMSGTAGTLYRLTLRGIYRASSTSTGLRINLGGAYTVFGSGDATIWYGPTAKNEVPLTMESANLTAAITGANVSGVGVNYPFRVEMFVRVVGGAPNVSVTYTNTAGTGTLTVLAGTTLTLQQLN